MGLVKYGVTLVVSVLVIMFIIYMIKKGTAKVNIPFVSDMAAQV